MDVDITLTLSRAPTGDPVSNLSESRVMQNAIYSFPEVLYLVRRVAVEAPIL